MILGTEFAIGYGSTDESVAMLIFLIVIMGVGLVFYWMIKPVLRRRAAEGEGNESRGIEQPLEDDNSMP